MSSTPPGDVGITVFAGPCLAGTPSPDGVRLRPPAQRGDILHALGDRPHTLLLLDGYYYDVPAVTHKELLYALDSGVRVLGAASMGALRAAELADCGMEGVGTIFSWYRDGRIEGDDEVALLHADAENNYRPLTAALVEVRHALDTLLRQRAIEQAKAEALVARLSALSFMDREPAVVRREARRIWGESQGDRVAQAIATADLKRRDALHALDRARGTTPAPQPAPAMELPETTIFLGYHRERAMGPHTLGAPTFQQACHLLQVLHPAAPDFVHQLRHRFLLASAAAEAGLAVAEEALQQLAAQLEARQAASCNQPLLPHVEVLAEATLHQQAITAVDHFGSPEAACADLASRFGLEADTTSGEAALLALLAAQYDLLPAWHLIRAITFTSALPSALAAAEAALEVHRCFRRWARGARIATLDLEALAATLWHCPTTVASEAARRGLFPSYGFAPGFREAVELIAPAERLPKAINDYPARRQALQAASLAYPLAMPW